MALRGVCIYRTTILLLKLLVTYVDAQFINNVNNIVECSGGTANFGWTYATSTPVLLVEWKKNESSIALETGGTFTPEAPYVGRLTKISNAHVSLGSLSVADSGIYKSEVTYTNGNAYPSNSVSLVVYDELNNETRIKKTSGTRMVTLSPVFLDLSITYTWKSQDNVTLMTGFSLDVTEIGNYTMCISGGRADCLNPALNPCASIDVTGFDGCKYSDAELFLGGFSCFLIVFGITSIIMLIFLLCQMLPKIFEDKKANKIIIIVVFNSFALILGFALGFGLKECDKRDLGLGLGLGFGFILAIALVLTLYIYHKQCSSKKENEDENRFSLDSCFRKCQVKPEKEIESPPKFNSKKPEDSPKRVGNKTDVLKGDQSALKQKVLHSPLPLPPVDNSQPSKASDDKLSRKKLDPIAVENEEANSSEKKKKKKKRKKKKIDNETADNNVEEAGDNGNLN